MFYTRHSGVTLIGFTQLDLFAILPYLGWSRLMFEKFNRLRPSTPHELVLGNGRIITTAVPLEQRINQKTIRTMVDLESGLRAYIPNAGWTVSDSGIHRALTETHTGVRIRNSVHNDLGQVVVVGFSAEFLNQIAACGSLFHPDTIVRFCRTLDRRFPTRATVGPIGADGIERMRQLFTILTELGTAGTAGPLYTWLITAGTSLIRALRVTEDYKIACDAVTRWVGLLAKDRHLSDQFVVKHLSVRSICG